MGVSVCSSQLDFFPGSYNDDDQCDTAETLRQIVSGALSLASSGSLSIASPAVTSLQAPQACALQQMLPSMPLLTSCTALQQLEGVVCCSPRGPSWQKSGYAAAGKQQSPQCIADMQQCTAHLARNRPSVRRCLCLSLHTDDLAPGQDAAALPPPPFAPTVVPMPADALQAATGAATPAAVGAGLAGTPGTCVSCTHSVPNHRSRLQDWLGRMELQLHVPATPLVPPAEPCPAPKGPHVDAAAVERKKRAFAALSELSLSSPQQVQDHSSKRHQSCNSAAAAAVMDPAVEFAAAVGDTVPAGQDFKQEPQNVDGVPLPAFVILGVLSNGNSSSSN